MKISALLSALIFFGGALACAAAEDETDNSRAGVSVKLVLSTESYDPTTPSNATVQCVVVNRSDRPVEIPGGYDGESVRLLGKPQDGRSLSLQLSIWRPKPSATPTAQSFPWCSTFGQYWSKLSPSLKLMLLSPSWHWRQL